MWCERSRICWGLSIVCDLKMILWIGDITQEALLIFPGRLLFTIEYSPVPIRRRNDKIQINMHPPPSRPHYNNPCPSASRCPLWAPPPRLRPESSSLYRTLVSLLFLTGGVILILVVIKEEGKDRHVIIFRDLNLTQRFWAPTGAQGMIMSVCLCGTSLWRAVRELKSK